MKRLTPDQQLMYLNDGGGGKRTRTFDTLASALAFRVSRQQARTAGMSQ